MGSPASTQTSKTEIDPEFKPFVKFGLTEGKRLYEAMPEAPETLGLNSGLWLVLLYSMLPKLNN
jgi:hypothetical protein